MLEDDDRNLTLFEDGTVECRGESWRGNWDPGDKQSLLVDVEDIAWTAIGGCAARKRDGSVVTWGRPRYGGDAGPKEAQLTDVVSVTPNREAFAAKKRDGSVISWGLPDSGGNTG